MVKFSKEYVFNSFTMIEHAFILEYMPYAPEVYSKVYLLGLSLASRGDESENSLEKIASRLSIEFTTVIEAFSYWQNEGIIHLKTNGQSPEVEYLPVRSARERIIKFKPQKYEAFNKQLQSAIPERNILPNEFHEYYMLMEIYHIEENAMLEIVGYCTRRKGMNVGYPYVIAVARNLASEGKTSYEAVHESLVEADTRDPKLLTLFKKLKIKRAPDYEDSALYKKWLEYGFNEDAILYAAKKCKKGGMAYLNTVLTKYHEGGIQTAPEMQDFDLRRDEMFAIAKGVNYFLGVKYEQLDYLIDHYVVDWIALGFEKESILLVAEDAAKRSWRTWEGLDTLIREFYSRGVVSKASMDKHYMEVEQADVLIKKLFSEAGVEKDIVARDRASFRTWTYSWGFSEEMLFKAASLARGKLSPLPYMNSILANWFHDNIKTLAQVEASATALSAPAIQKHVGVVSESEAESNLLYEQALQDEVFLQIETQIRTLEFELAKNASKQLEEELAAAYKNRAQRLKQLNINL